MPNPTAEDLAKALDSVLHELRNPISVAQGYLRLLLENRLTESPERQHALRRSLEELGRIAALCTSLSDYIHGNRSVECAPYAAAELVEALRADCDEQDLTFIVHPAVLQRTIDFLPIPLARSSLLAVLRASLRNAPAPRRVIQVATLGPDLVITSGGSAFHDQLMTATDRADFNPWAGGTGLQVPLAVNCLAQAGLRIWTLPTDTVGIGMAIPLRRE
jgi:signal transduction histidine kinase